MPILAAELRGISAIFLRNRSKCPLPFAASCGELDPVEIKIALKACRLIGHDFYGVDIKMIGDKPAIIEINDNQSIDHPWEDAYLSDELYSRIMLEFVNRMEHKRVHYDD